MGPSLMSETKVSSRAAQDTLVLIFLALAGLGLAIAGPLLAIPMLGLFGLPIGGIAALLFAILVLWPGGFEVGWSRQIAGLASALGGIAGLGYGYLQGLGTIAAHYLDRAGAPPLGELWQAVPWVLAGGVAVAASIVLRRAHGGAAPAVGAAVVGGLTVGLGWGLLVVLGILGVPLGA